MPPIETKNMTAADVDQLTTLTRDSMLKSILEMAQTLETKVEPQANGVSTAIEI